MPEAKPTANENARLAKPGNTAASAGPAGSPARPTSTRKPAAKNDDSTSVAGVKLSNPDKLYFPEIPLTKRDIANYYANVADWMIPHIKDRPLSLVRCPDGWSGQCFYQKNADKAVHASVSRIEVPESKGKATYMGANTTTALVGLLQWGVIEMHPWGATSPKLDNPDRLIFDFDPDDGLAWPKLVEAVNLLKTLLEDLKLTGFLKTTGGKGLHVVLPIRATLSWDDAKGFTKAVADLLVGTFPDRFTAIMSKERRKGRIFIDYLRNAQGATAIAPYAVRARKGAPVSAPLAWDELKRDVRFDYFNATNMLERLQQAKSDPWADFFDVKQTITQAMFQRVGLKSR
jgi:bifunctional non-homologous end joining protein LigD